MIQLTRLNGNSIVLNSDLIKTAEASPDTMLTLINGYLAGAILFVILQALGILWSISPAWRRTSRGTAGAVS